MIKKGEKLTSDDDSISLLRLETQHVTDPLCTIKNELEWNSQRISIVVFLAYQIYNKCKSKKSTQLMQMNILKITLGYLRQPF